jgi:SAM-dependent methyltransferase
LKTLFTNYGDDEVIVNYGSGPVLLNGRRDLINVDICAFDAVDVLSDTRLPFKEGSVDLILSVAVLEHMSRPSLAVQEMLRCLRPNGELLVFVPFMAPLHAAPHDYQRWTEAGLHELFRDFVMLQSGIGAGPTSAFLWLLQHCFADLLSFGILTIEDLLLVVLMLVTFPLKYLYMPFCPEGGHCRWILRSRQETGHRRSED